MRPSKIRRILTDHFDPLTLAVFDLPYDMSEKDVEDLLGKYGTLMDVDLLPMFSERVDGDGFFEEDDSSRKLTLVTFEEREEGKACMRQLHRKKILFPDGDETHLRRIGIKIGKKQDFKQRLQAQLDEEFEERQEWADPELRRIKRRAERDLRELMP